MHAVPFFVFAFYDTFNKGGKNVAYYFCPVFSALTLVAVSTFGLQKVPLYDGYQQLTFGFLPVSVVVVVIVVVVIVVVVVAVVVVAAAAAAAAAAEEAETAFSVAVEILPVQCLADAVLLADSSRAVDQ